MPKVFEIKSRMKNGAMVLHVIGDLDGSSASELALLLENAVGRNEQIVIDTTRVRNLHPFGQAVLDKALKRLRRNGSELLLTGAGGVGR
jgi:anti-anti-sigma factor